MDALSKVAVRNKAVVVSKAEDASLKAADSKAVAGRSPVARTRSTVLRVQTIAKANNVPVNPKDAKAARRSNGPARLPTTLR